MTIEYLTERCTRFTWVARRYHPVIFGWLAERYRLRIQLRNSMSYSRALVAATVALLLAACGNSDPDLAQYGPNPELPEPRRGLLPDMTMPEPAPWGDQLPTVPEGYKIGRASCRATEERWWL